MARLSRDSNSSSSNIFKIIDMGVTQLHAGASLSFREIDGSGSEDKDESLAWVDQQMLIDLNVKQTYHSSDGTLRRSDAGYIARISSQIACHKLASEEEGRAIIARMISRMNLNFPLERIQWQDYCYQNQNQNQTLTLTLTQLERPDDLIQRILAKARSSSASTTVFEPSKLKFGHKLLFHMNVRIENRVILARHDLEVMERKKEMKKCVGSLHELVSLMVQSHMSFDGIVKEIQRAVDGLRNGVSVDKKERRILVKSLIDRAKREMLEPRPVPATHSSIRALEKVTLDDSDSDSDSTKACDICKEEMWIGSPVTRMPCSHIFHPPCIEKWLTRSHTCPLCRFKLPTT